MGVVDVDGDLVGQIAEGVVLLEMALQNALQRGRDEQVLLLEAQALAARMVVGGVEHLGDRLGHGVLLERADVVAAREGRHVEALGQLGAPEGELVDGLAVPAGDIHVVRDGHDGLVADLGGLELAVVDPLVHLAAEAHLDGVVLAGVQPHVAHGEPVVGEFHLPAAHDLLAEDAELIADGEACHRIAQMGGGVHIAGREAAEAAVAETGVRLHGAETVEAEAQPLQNMPDGVEESQIVEIVAKRRADQELHGTCSRPACAPPARTCFWNVRRFSSKSSRTEVQTTR
jgi:hypothetical protein